MAQTRAQTRAQEDAKRRRSPDDQGQDSSPTRKRQRRTIHPTPSKEIQGEDRKRAIEDACGVSPQPSSKRRPTSRPSKDAGGLSPKPSSKRRQTSRPSEDACGLSPKPSSKRRQISRPSEDVYNLSPKPSSKRRQTSRPSTEDTFAEATGHRDPKDPIGFWVREGVWPREVFEVAMYERALARRRSSFPSLGRKRSNSATSTTPTTATTPSGVKNAQYRDPRFKMLLGTKGVFVDTQSDHGITVESKTSYMALLTSEQTIPTDSLFRDDLFEETCRNVANKTEARLFVDISPLIVPRAEILATYGSAGLKCLIESINEAWNRSMPLAERIPRPQPDYSVGFRQEAFTNDQLTKLKPFVGDPLADELSFFMATDYMYFPFLACEVKSGLKSSELDVAELQNANSMALAARGIVELFRSVGRENEVHRQILSFSVSHNHHLVQIYGYYPVIDGKDTKYYRHPIHEFSFTTMDGKEKWTAYRFVKNIYDNWMPDHFKRICSAIDQLPDLDFQVPPLSESNGLSQDLGNQVELSEADPESLRMDKDKMPAPAKRRKE